MKEFKVIRNVRDEVYNILLEKGYLIEVYPRNANNHEVQLPLIRTGLFF